MPLNNQLVQSLHIHRESMTSQLYDRLTLSARNIRRWHEDYHDFFFDPMVFTHATLLLRNSPIPYGSDLRHYLAPVREYFQSGERKLRCIRFNSDSTDFRRRASEEFGVAIASLLMVDLLGVRWESIAQIPLNKALTKRRPDFIGYTSANESVIFEAKGSTSLGKAREGVADAREQVKDYPPPNGQAPLGKFAISSYFPAEEVAFPAFSFVADPPFPDTFLPSIEGCTELHTLNVLNFMEMSESHQAYISMLTANSAVRNVPYENKHRRAALTERAQIAAAAYFEKREAEEAHLEDFIVAGIPLRGRVYPAKDGLNFNVYVGLAGPATLEKMKEKRGVISEGDEAISVLPDGTVLGIKSTSLTEQRGQ